jgi:hypothetical protein
MPNYVPNFSANVTQLIKESFFEWDVDGSGTLSKGEFTLILIRCGMKKNDAIALFDNVDANDDDEIDLDEFIDWLMCAQYQLGPSDSTTWAHAIRKKAIHRDPNDPKKSRQPAEVLPKRFPDRSLQEVQHALLLADGHGGRAAAYLQGKWKPEASKMKSMGERMAMTAETAHLVVKQDVYLRSLS